MRELHMKDLKENQVEFWYQEYEGEEIEYDEDGNKTGDKILKYKNPVKAIARITATAGSSTESPFGKDLVYDRSISTVQKLPINEYTKLFIDVVPVINEDGSTDTEPDYACVNPAIGIHQNVWAIRKIKGTA